ncbi:Rha family phage regulatory protein [Striga asiatica]|uniref:Rha family phage regulatory protein n=1 Tax=Striga asiatica TaxID=4170 RepID=A0A5A7PAF8_STRAF|nr:Rha family phage regulatory protein [Striga asiatica]
MLQLRSEATTLIPFSLNLAAFSTIPRRFFCDEYSSFSTNPGSICNMMKNYILDEGHTKLDPMSIPEVTSLLLTFEARPERLEQVQVNNGGLEKAMWSSSMM